MLNHGCAGIQNNQHSYDPTGIHEKGESGCSELRLEKSIQNHIYTLPAETKILPGHGPDTLVGDEIRANPFVRPL